ncbi:MAG: zf-HC2 domain-containing protein [Rubrivivax sp.]
MIKLRSTCKEATRLLLEAEERRLGLAERIGVRLHLLACEACPRFERQLRLMRRAYAQWRRYADGDEPPR